MPMKPKAPKTPSRGAKGKQKVSGPRPPAPLTVKEVGEILTYIQHLNGLDIRMGFEDRILKEGPSQDEFGEIAGLPAVQFIKIAQIMEDACMNHEDGIPAFNKFRQWVADNVIDAIMRGDPELFEHLATLVKMNPSNWATVRFRDLGIKQSKGRKPQPYDLDRVGPLAIQNRLLLRIMRIDGVHLTHRLTRAELRSEIRELQAECGLKGRSSLSEGNLSRLITKMGVGRFMDSKSCKPEGELAKPFPPVVGPSGPEEMPLL